MDHKPMYVASVGDRGCQQKKEKKMKDEGKRLVKPSIIYIRTPVSLWFISINMMSMLLSFGFLLTPYFHVVYLTISNSIIWPPHLSVTMPCSISVFWCHSFTLDLNITWNLCFSEIATTDNCISDHLLPSFQLTHFNSPLSFLPIHQPFLSWVSFYPEYIAHILNSLDSWSFHWSYLAKPRSWMNPLSACSNFFLVINSYPFTLSR